MAQYAHSDVLNDGLNAIKNGVVKMHLLKTFSLAAVDYATIDSNTICSVVMASGDFTITGADGAARILTTAAGKNAAASDNSGAGPDLHIAFTNGSTKVFWVTDETSNQVVTSGNTVNFPQITYTNKQPTSV